MKTRLIPIFSRFTMVIALLSSLAGSAIFVTPVYAASIVVNSNADNDADDGVCTLREAILAAVNTTPRHSKPGECTAGSSGPDTISFAGNFTITILREQLDWVTSPITIKGNGAENTVIQAAASPDVATWRVFQVTPTGNLTLEGVTVRYGRCNGLCTDTHNSGYRNAGGGIYNSGILLIKNSVISGNRGDYAGGIFNSGTLTIQNSSTVTGNTASGSENGGGGIYNTGAVTVVNSTISNNSAGAGGGGIFSAGTLTITSGTISGNTASVFGSGGGIYNTGSVVANYSTFSKNSGGEGGGGIFNNFGTLTVNTSTFSENGGSGIYSNGTLTVENTTFSRNSSEFGGGGISNDGTMVLTKSTFVGNSGGDGGGGGLQNSDAATIANSTFSGNTASDGGAIYNFWFATLTVINTTISGNETLSLDTGAGGISNDGGATIILRNTIVADNAGTNCKGIINNSGYNLDSGTSCGWGSNVFSMSNTDPLLGPLASNGGPTQTMALLAGSPAINRGLQEFCNAFPVNGVDQRGVNRPLGYVCDIGAYETSDGDGPDTVGVFRPSNGVIFLKNLNISGFADLALNYGLGGDYPVVGDWDGNGTDTIGVYRNGVFLLRNSNSIGFANLNFVFGQAGDQPIAGDWNGDGIDTIGVYRPSAATFYLRNTNSAGMPDITFSLGNVGDVGIAGDWDGDGTDTTGVFRPSSGVIFLKNKNQTGFADVSLNYGMPGDKPVVGDWDDNGTTTIGIYRGNKFYLRNSNTNGFANITLDLGIPGDMPIAGNWDGAP